jgi:hypothetical protein
MSSQRSSKLLSQSRFAPIRGIASSAVLLQALVSLALLASPAMALPVDVFFNGIASGGTSFGISAASATNARDNFGIPILDIATGPLGSTFTVTLPPSSQLISNPSPPTSTSLNRIQSPWKIDNTSGGSVLGAAYLLFTNTSAYTFAGTNKSIDYPDANVGLQIDKDLGWALVHTRSGQSDYYYPALLLDRSVANPLQGNLSAGERVTAAINYVTTVPLTGVTSGGTLTYALPKLNLGYAIIPVPEPGTALLLGLSLTVLAARRKSA